MYNSHTPKQMYTDVYVDRERERENKRIEYECNACMVLPCAASKLVRKYFRLNNRVNHRHCNRPICQPLPLNC